MQLELLFDSSFKINITIEQIFNRRETILSTFIFLVVLAMLTNLGWLPACGSNLGVLFLTLISFHLDLSFQRKSKIRLWWG